MRALAYDPRTCIFDVVHYCGLDNFDSLICK
jgi:hypothetical protein